MPRPWWASSTTKATSASAVSAVPGQPVVPADRDDLVVEHRHQRHPVAVVDVREPVQVPLRDPRVRPEVPQVAGAVGEPGVERDERVRVLRADRPQVHHAAVGDDDVGLPAAG